MKKVIIIIILLLSAAAVYHYKTYGRERDANGILVLYGNVDIRDVNLGFRVAGRVEKMHREEGDQVKAGEILASLDQRPFQDQLNLKLAQLKEVEAGLSYAEKMFERRRNLVKTGAVSQSDYDDALARRDELKAGRETAIASLALAETSLNDTALLAPADGTILTRVREPGSIVAEGAIIYTLSLDNPVWIRTYISEPNLGNIYPGQKVSVYTDSGDSYVGRIGFISPQAEFTPKTVETTQLRTDLVYRLRVIVDNPDKRLRQGMPVTVKFDR